LGSLSHSFQTRSGRHVAWRWREFVDEQSSAYLHPAADRVREQTAKW